ncbi:MAG: hypothetical protein IJV65_01480, partial [Kiritimatiellae bacterium]|nr:hypothetical protein [Kiritimatiellia bacterium]
MTSTGIFENAIEVDRALRAQGIDTDYPLTFALVGWAFRNVAGGLAAAAACCQKRYQIYRRKGDYWNQKRWDDAKSTFIRELHALDAEYATDPDHPDAPSKQGYNKRYSAILKRFMTTRADLEREAEERHRAERAANPDPPPWLAPKAIARRAAFRARRDRAWWRWADKAKAAVARGFAPPPGPGERRRTGAPVRRLCRASVNPVPDIADVIAAYKAARGRGRVAEKIRCGSLLLDAEAGVDSSLVRTAAGEIVGRKPGLRGWIGDRAPWLLNHYVSLMQYRRLAQAFREAHGLRDPHPATLLLDDEGPKAFPQPMRGRLEAARREAKAL